MAPLRAAVLADPHLGSHTNDIARFEKIVAEVNDWQPDIVLLLGDFINTQIFGRGHIPPDVIAHVLGPLKARLGTYAILGNHDWIYDGRAVWRALEAVGITVLENDSLEIKDQTGDFWLVGLADDQTRRPEARKTLEPIPDAALKLVMAHDPATFADIPTGPNLTLCGHTHGGQVRLPFVGPLVNSSRAPLRWTSGHVVEDGRHLFVSRGLGTSGIPLRFNCPPEVCFLSIGG
ncbi:metallophosphoesterase [Pelagibius sp. Alg239-R121]|uniref:metallophosphoesterase n=1 Tax=Pelagibius sp. Alg239-R121 TaxID=2993448 RepID=UPI0024A64A0C|nr:metallophosphoesterase [Pelagibius sp. Alg239-R121]